MEMERNLKKKNPKNKICFKVKEVFDLYEAYVDVVDEKLLIRSRNLRKFHASFLRTQYFFGLKNKIMENFSKFPKISQKYSKKNLQAYLIFFFK
jgi:hypothetical protein